MRSIRIRWVPSLIGLCMVLFFAGFGYLPYGSAALPQIHHVLTALVTGRDWTDVFYGIYPKTTWYSVRLIGVAMLFSIAIGVVGTLISARIHRSWLRTLSEAGFVTLESVPDTLYVIFTVLLVVYLLENFSINLPAFSAFDPTWKDTWIPALALSLPGALYLRRMLSVQLGEELHAHYISTARSKGASSRRVFYRHVFPNLIPTLLNQLGFVFATILSTALFAEFFMGYEGQLFFFTRAIGLDMEHGDMEHTYHAGSVFAIGALLVLLWFLISNGISLLSRWLVPRDLVRSSAYQGQRIHKGWLIAGSVLLAVVLLFGLFPHLLTHWAPTQKDMGSLDAAGPPFVPLPPSHVHWFGTDTLGHDILSWTLYGTVRSLITPAAITLLVLVGSLVLAATAVSTSKPWLSRALKAVSEGLSTVPTFFVLYLALYHRIDILWLQNLQYILWFFLFEVGKTAYTFLENMQSWFRFGFVEGALSVGQSRLRILMTNLRPWLMRFLLEFSFAEFVRVMSIMAQLAALHVYVTIMVGPLPYKQAREIVWPQGIISANPTWFGMLGDSTLSMNYLSYPTSLLAPVLAIALTVVGANFILRGLRGGNTASGRL